MSFGNHDRIVTHKEWETIQRRLEYTLTLEEIQQVRTFIEYIRAAYNEKLSKPKVKELIASADCRTKRMLQFEDLVYYGDDRMVFNQGYVHTDDPKVLRVVESYRAGLKELDKLDKLLREHYSKKEAELEIEAIKDKERVNKYKEAFLEDQNRKRTWRRLLLSGSWIITALLLAKSCSL